MLKLTRNQYSSDSRRIRSSWFQSMGLSDRLYERCFYFGRRNKAKQFFLSEHCQMVLPHAQSMRKYSPRTGLVFFVILAFITGCNPSNDPLSRINRANYAQIHEGMSKEEVQRILGPPTSVSTEDKIIYKRTIWRYVKGDKYINLTFKNDELDSKDTNLGTQ